jgi:hypothetical protein
MSTILESVILSAAMPIFESVILSVAKDPSAAQISPQGFELFCPQSSLLASLSQEAPATIEVIA